MQYTLLPKPASKETYNKRPVVMVLANSSQDANLPTQTIDDKYCQAIIETTDATCLIIPTISPERELDSLLEIADGIILTGDTSNVEPKAYGKEGNIEEYGPYDIQRDNISIYLIKKAFDLDIPVLGICRGMQEMNVALGGTLQKIRPDVADIEIKHMSDKALLLPEDRYSPSHSISLPSSGMLYGLLGNKEIMVNSLHVQMVDQLANGLIVDAFASDGVVEAFHHPEKNFFLGVQWHVEFQAFHNEVSRKIFMHFNASL